MQQHSIRFQRNITGISAILLPFTTQGEIDWTGFERHVARTISAGLIPAVNMDTGFVHLLEDDQRREVLRRTASIAGAADWVAGAFVGDGPGEPFDLAEQLIQVDAIIQAGGTPVICQSFGLTAGDDGEVIERYRAIAQRVPRFYAFELGTMFAPFGRIYGMELYGQLMRIPQCIGAKHSSLDRRQEWDRLALRDRVRPEFLVLTGNDLAIDMVMYGSDYLLGLSTMAPDLFGLRDRLWMDGDDRFFEVNDLLQYLGRLAFREPVPAYKHSAAIVMRARGWIASDQTHPRSPERTSADRELLMQVAAQLDAMSRKFGLSVERGAIG